MLRGGRKIVIAVLALVGCGGQLSPDSDSTLSGIDGEGLPLVASMPRASGSCSITNPPYRAIETASWDAGTRTFTMSGQYWKLDEQGRTLESGPTGGEWRQLMTRDEHGVLTAFTYESQGALIADKSWDQSNGFDPGGRLTSSVLVYRSGTRQVTSQYQYDDDGLLINVSSVDQDAGQSIESWTKFYWSGGRLITRERGSGDLFQSRDTRYYNEEGRLGTIDLVGGELAPDVDGYIDLRGIWSYDAAGRLVRHEEDGAEPTDPPHLDGVPDNVAAFDAGCADIAVLPLQLYGLPSWVRLP